MGIERAKMMMNHQAIKKNGGKSRSSMVTLVSWLNL
jgi:hypothetical protein